MKPKRPANTAKHRTSAQASSVTQKIGEVRRIGRSRARHLTEQLRGGFHRLEPAKARPYIPRAAFAALVAAAVITAGFNVASATDDPGTGTAAAAATTVLDPTRSAQDDQATRGKDRSLTQDSGDAALIETKKQSEAQAEQEARDKAEAERKAQEEAAKRWTLPSDREISDVFGPRAWRGGEMHAGTDFAANAGEDNKAAFKGTVIQAGWNGGYGISVTIRHPDGEETVYGHNEEVLVSVGDEVETGQVIGHAGATGDVTGPHLHFEVHIDGEAIDPVPFLRDHGVDI